MQIIILISSICPFAQKNVIQISILSIAVYTTDTVYALSFTALCVVYCTLYFRLYRFTVCTVFTIHGSCYILSVGCEPHALSCAHTPFRPMPLSKACMCASLSRARLATLQTVSQSVREKKNESSYGGKCI